METTLLPFLPRKTILVVEDNKDCRQLQTIVIRKKKDEKGEKKEL